MIKGIYIVQKDNKPLFSYRKNDNTDFNQEVLLRILRTLREFAKGMEENLHDFVIGNRKYYFTRDKMNNTKIIIEADQTASDKNIQSVLKEIRNAYINEFLGEFILTQNEMEKKNKRFQEKLSEIIENRKIGVKAFLLNI
ncbi:MAG: hypothetical protein GF317_05450 [Candidatus Lokiarchaeota archaeon]|nr:hypothetical protein [Candidatus Lokiarchaeota archaeon]MBD3199253.1 hypothetical protein [Candidatus Lokiarchaeota archaeon]